MDLVKKIIAEYMIRPKQPKVLRKIGIKFKSFHSNK